MQHNNRGFRVAVSKSIDVYTCEMKLLKKFEQQKEKLA
jgi:hypothetical protein